MDTKFYIFAIMLIGGQTAIFCSGSPDLSKSTALPDKAQILAAIDTYELALNIYKDTFTDHQAAQKRLAEFDDKTPYYLRRATEHYHFVTPVTNDQADSGLKKRRDLIEAEVHNSKKNLDRSLADLEGARDTLYTAARKENIHIQEHQTLIQDSSHGWISLEEYKRKHSKKHAHHRRKDTAGCAIQ